MYEEKRRKFAALFVFLVKPVLYLVNEADVIIGYRNVVQDKINPISEAYMFDYVLRRCQIVNPSFPLHKSVNVSDLRR